MAGALIREVAHKTEDVAWRLAGTRLRYTEERMKGLGRLIFWDFKRASWQYDLVVAAILAFIFLTPRAFFGDQPKAPSIAMLPANQGYLLEPGLLLSIPDEQRARTATMLVQKRFKTGAVVQRVEAVFEDDALTGYMAFTTP